MAARRNKAVDPGPLQLTEDEKKAIQAGPRPPFLITHHWASLLNGSNDDPLRKQVVPTTDEWRKTPLEHSDPLGEARHSPLPRLIRRYRDRVVVVVTGKCALYCRHCFRRRLTGNEYGPIDDSTLSDICNWLAEHDEVKELLLSGGDPLTLSDRQIIHVFRSIRTARPDLVIRLATRMPIVNPRRVTRSLARRLGAFAPLWTVVQINHPRELSPETLISLGRLQSRGIPVINQAVLLKGINDNVDTLENLSRSLVRGGIKPYYLFQGDLAEGTGHFRVPLEEARELVDQLRCRVSGLAMPNFAVDLPGGGGKVPLTRDYVQGLTSGQWHLITPDGVEGLYPDPEPLDTAID